MQFFPQLYYWKLYAWVSEVLKAMQTFQYSSVIWIISLIVETFRMIFLSALRLELGKIALFYKSIFTASKLLEILRNFSYKVEPQFC